MKWLLVWLLVSFPLGVLIGTCIRLGTSCECSTTVADTTSTGRSLAIGETSSAPVDHEIAYLLALGSWPRTPASGRSGSSGRAGPVPRPAHRELLLRRRPAGPAGA